jgi:hypothetical protein
VSIPRRENGRSSLLIANITARAYRRKTEEGDERERRSEGAKTDRRLAMEHRASSSLLLCLLVLALFNGECSARALLRSALAFSLLAPAALLPLLPIKLCYSFYGREFLLLRQARAMLRSTSALGFLPVARAALRLPLPPLLSIKLCCQRLSPRILVNGTDPMRDFVFMFQTVGSFSTIIHVLG